MIENCRFIKNSSFVSAPPQTWLQNKYRRRRSESRDVSETMGKASKMKPLSQDIPIEKKWDLKQAEEALNIEKEYNKRYKIHSVIIKFPDPELNKEMVTKFHQAIEKVHFQQPSTPRICHVTLKVKLINAINFKATYTKYITFLIVTVRNEMKLNENICLRSSEVL